MKKTGLFFITGMLLASCGGSSREVEPQYKSITETVFASGTLEPNGKYNLTAQTEGYLVRVNFTDGDVVKSGDLLAVIDNQQNVYNEQSAQDLYRISKNNASLQAPALKQSEANIALAEEKLKQDELQFSRYKKLLESNSVSKLEYENAKLAVENSRTALFNQKQNYSLLKQQADQQLIAQEAQKNISAYLSSANAIRAVVGGKVYKKFKENGDYVRRGDVLATIGSESEIYARINVDETNISKIKLGQKVLLQLNTNKEHSYRGTLYEILPAFEEMSQSFICKVRFDEAIPLKISGTQLQANVIIGTKEKAFVIPREYLDYGNKVYLKGEDDPRVVKTGFISSEWVEILGGLKPTDVLVEIRK